MVTHPFPTRIIYLYPGAHRVWGGKHGVHAPGTVRRPVIVGERPQLTVALSCLSQGECAWYWEANLEALGIFHVFWNI